MNKEDKVKFIKSFEKEQGKLTKEERKELDFFLDSLIGVGIGDLEVVDAEEEELFDYSDRHDFKSYYRE